MNAPITIENPSRLNTMLKAKHTAIALRNNNSFEYAAFLKTFGHTKLLRIIIIHKRINPINKDQNTEIKVKVISDPKKNNANNAITSSINNIAINIFPCN